MWFQVMKCNVVNQLSIEPGALQRCRESTDKGLPDKDSVKLQGEHSKYAYPKMEHFEYIQKNAYKESYRQSYRQSTASVIPPRFIQ